MTSSPSSTGLVSVLRSALGGGFSTAVLVGGVLLLSCARSWGQTAACTSAIENATVVIPDTVSIEGAESTFFSPDSVAILSPDGTCVGAARWRGGGRTTMAVAGSGPFEEDGLDDGGSFRFRLYDVQGKQHQDGTPTFVRCERFTGGLRAFCRDDGRYEDDAIYILRSMRLGPPTPNEGISVQTLKLSAPYPNPVQGPVHIRFATPERQKVELRLYDALGRVVRTFGNGMVKGHQGIRVDLSGLASGAYFLRLRSEGETRTRRITVVR